MKKTIAILLILVIGMVGVFAATATVDVTTEISALNEIGITSIAVTDATKTYADFQSFLSTNAIESPVSVNTFTAATATTIGHLTFFTNSTSGFTTSFVADVLKDSDTSNPVDSTIGYTVIVGRSRDAQGETTEAGITQDAGITTSSDDLTLVNSSATDSSIGSRSIEVYLDESDFNSAAIPEGDYVGTITFTYTAS